jgi:hypothetical protein
MERFRIHFGFCASLATISQVVGCCSSECAWGFTEASVRFSSEEPLTTASDEGHLYLLLDGFVVEDQGEPIPIEHSLLLYEEGSGTLSDLELLYRSDAEPCIVAYTLTLSFVNERWEQQASETYPSVDLSMNGETVDVEPWPGTLLEFHGAFREYCHFL